jgi:hypothetical protein
MKQGKPAGKDGKLSRKHGKPSDEPGEPSDAVLRLSEPSKARVDEPGRLPGLLMCNFTMYGNESLAEYAPPCVPRGGWSLERKTLIQ